MTTEARKSIRLIDLGKAPSWQTQAYYHAVAELMDENTPDTIILCQPDTPYLCLGYHQDYESVLNREAVESLKLPVYRRRVGGGTTYLDANQLFYQYIFHRSRVPLDFTKVYERMLSPAVGTLKKLGLNAKLRSINEIEVDQDRIAGIGGGRIGEACVVVGNLLFDFDYQTMAEVWHSPWESFRELAANALEDHVMTLKRLIATASIENVKEIMIDSIADNFKREIEIGSFSDEEKEHAEKLALKLTSEEYLALHSNAGSSDREITPLKITARVYIHAVEFQIYSQKVQASFLVREGVIEEARFNSENGQKWIELENKMINVYFNDWQSHIFPKEGAVI